MFVLRLQNTTKAGNVMHIRQALTSSVSDEKSICAFVWWGAFPARIEGKNMLNPKEKNIFRFGFFYFDLRPATRTTSAELDHSPHGGLGRLIAVEKGCQSSYTFFTHIAGEEAG